MPRLARTPTAVLFALAAIASLHARPSRLSVLPGTATIEDGASIPTGSRLRVALHDLSPGIAKEATVATMTIEAEGRTPLRFELSYNESVIEPSRLYGVAAAVTDSRGRALWETRVPIRVLTLGNQKKVQLVLRPTERPKAPPEPTSFAVECGGLRFDVDINATSATVVFQDSRIVLPRTETVSGKRYSDGATTLAVSGSAVYLQRQGKAYRDCKLRADAASGLRP